jgi:hypothetical protein
MRQFLAAEVGWKSEPCGYRQGGGLNWGRAEPLRGWFAGLAWLDELFGSVESNRWALSSQLPRPMASEWRRDTELREGWRWRGKPNVNREAD